MRGRQHVLLKNSLQRIKKTLEGFANDRPPHNTLAELVQEDPSTAEATILNLSKVFRFALDSTHRGAVSLGEEIEFVQSYLEVEPLSKGGAVGRLQSGKRIDIRRRYAAVLKEKLGT
jgi:histidine kinase